MNNQRKHIWRISKVLVALCVIICTVIISGCSKKSDATIYLSGMSRIRMNVDSNAQIKDLSSLNKGAKVLVDGLEWKGKKDTDILDAMIQKMQTEETPYIYIDVVSEDKNWEAEEINKLTEYFSDSAYESEIPVQIRKVTDLDEIEESKLFSSNDSTEPQVVIIPESTEPVTTPEEETEESSGTEESSAEAETTAEETTTAVPSTAAPTTAAQTTTAPTTAPPTAAPATTAPTEASAPETEPSLPETEASTQEEPTSAEPREAETTTAQEVPPTAGNDDDEAPFGPGW